MMTDLSKQQGATRWTSDTPDKAYWNPTGGGWQEINEGMLSNPDIAKAVMEGTGNTWNARMAPGGSQAYNIFSGLKSKIPTGVSQGVSGSSYSLSPDVLSKMWR